MRKATTEQRVIMGERVIERRRGERVNRRGERGRDNSDGPKN